MHDSVRLFIAIPLPIRFQPALSSLSEALKKRWPFQTWVHPLDYHITVKFLGECDLRTTGLVKERLHEIARSQSPFILAIEGLGTFGAREKPRILWTGVKGELHRLAQLQQRVEERMEEIGFPREKRPYHPHLTLARNFTGIHFHPDELEMAPMAEGSLAQWDVRELVLYRTHLGRRPMYQALARFPFEGQAEKR